MFDKWECSRYTKRDSMKTAREQYEYFINEKYKYCEEIKILLENNVPKNLKKIGYLTNVNGLMIYLFI